MHLKGLFTLVAVATLSCGGSSQEAAMPEPEEENGANEPAPSEPSGDLDGAPESVVNRLIQDFDVAALNGTTTEEAQAFIREHEGRLTSIYVDDYAELSPKTRIALLNLLVSFQTETTVRAHAMAISRYAKGEASVDEAIWACQAAKRTKNAELADALMKAFNAIDMSDRDGQRFGKHLADAMEFNVVPGWTATLEKHRDATIESPDSFGDSAAVKTYRNKTYWKETSVRLLERLKSGGAG